MAYPEDLVGKFIDYKVYPGGSPRNWSGHVVNGLLPGQTSNASLNVLECERDSKPGSKFEIVISSLNPKPRWNFTFLNYEPGYVTTAPLAAPVLTGPMSGCYLFTYTHRGAAMVAHVGTYMGENTTESIKAKLSWLRAADDVDITQIAGGNPLDYFRDVNMSSVRGIPGKPNIFGYFTSTAAYAIMLFNIAANINAIGPHLSKVVAVKKMHLQPWSSIAALRTFRDVADDDDLIGIPEIQRL